MNANELHEEMRKCIDEYNNKNNKYPSVIIIPKEYKDFIDILFIKLSMYGALLSKKDDDYVFCNAKIKFDDVDDIICDD